METTDLNPSDVLLFSGVEESFISKAIMYLTDAPVSHAALYYREPKKIIEATPPAVQVTETDKRFPGRTITVMRDVRPGLGSLEEVLKKADIYLNDEQPFGMSNLYTLAVIMVYAKFAPRSPMKKVMIKILKRVTVTITDAINRRTHPGKKPMTCSQFIYQCFDDAARRLKIVGAPIPPGLKSRASNAVDWAIEVAGLQRSSGSLQTLEGPANGLPIKPEETDEMLAKELYEELKKSDATTESADGQISELDQELIFEIDKLGRQVSSERMEGRLDGLTFLKDNHAYFVSPGDLFNYCEDLKKVGTIESYKDLPVEDIKI